MLCPFQTRKAKRFCALTISTATCSCEPWRCQPTYHQWQDLPTSRPRDWFCTSRVILWAGEWEFGKNHTNNSNGPLRRSNGVFPVVCGSGPPIGKLKDIRTGLTACISSNSCCSQLKHHIKNATNTFCSRWICITDTYGMFIRGRHRID